MKLVLFEEPGLWIEVFETECSFCGERGFCTEGDLGMLCEHCVQTDCDDRYNSCAPSDIPCIRTCEDCGNYPICAKSIGNRKIINVEITNAKIL